MTPRPQTSQVVGDLVTDDVPGRCHRGRAAGQPLQALRMEDPRADVVTRRRNVGHKRFSGPCAGSVPGAEDLSNIDVRYRGDHVVEEFLDGRHLDPARVDPPPGRVAEHRAYAGQLADIACRDVPPLGGDQQPLDGEQEVLNLRGGKPALVGPHRQAHVMLGQPEHLEIEQQRARIGVCPDQPCIPHRLRRVTLVRQAAGVPRLDVDRGTVQVVQHAVAVELGAAVFAHAIDHLPEASGIVLAVIVGSQRGGAGRLDDSVECFGGQVGGDKRVLRDRAHVVTAGPGETIRAKSGDLAPVIDRAQAEEGRDCGEDHHRLTRVGPVRDPGQGKCGSPGAQGGHPRAAARRRVPGHGEHALRRAAQGSFPVPHRVFGAGPGHGRHLKLGLIQRIKGRRLRRLACAVAHQPPEIARDDA
jgi:hypothetical protein